MIHKSTAINITVKTNRPETSGYRSIIFERPRGFNFEAGDWVDLAFPGSEFKGGKTYSLSSSPTEPDLMITFKDGLSEFKTALMTLKTGDSLIITQYGNDYKFTLQPHATSTLIAGGVGIAPFRSMLKEMHDSGSSNQVHLLYFNKNDDFLFKEELQHWSRQIQGLTIDFVTTADIKRKAKEQAIKSVMGGMDQTFYIAGPEAMVEHTEHLLMDNGVAVKNIKIDSFGGY